MHSCIYEGIVLHHRRKPVNHRFQYRLYMVYLDLDELPRLVGTRGLISDRKLAPRAFLRGDHLFEPSALLSDELRDLIRSHTGRSATGPIRLLTQLRCFGYYMSPLNLYYVFDPADRDVEFVVAEVNNTPWKERHCYVLWDGNRIGGPRRLRFAQPKEFHVSPFMGMDIDYHWRLNQPGRHLRIQIANHGTSGVLFGARMALDRRPLTRQQMRRMTVRFPVMTARITTAIYFQACKLWWKKCPFHSHPARQSRQAAPRQPVRRIIATSNSLPQRSATQHDMQRPAAVSSVERS